ncbi:MAG: outer membrane protein [Pyrinomonadaceae bacterium]
MLMRKSLLAVLFLACSAASAFAQDRDYPKVEVFGGYSYLRADIQPRGGDFGGGENLNGFHAQISGNIKRNFSIAGDISGHYKSFAPDAIDPDISITNARASLYNFLAGPQIKARRGRVTPFAEALFGVARARVSATINDLDAVTSFSDSETKFAYALGGGLDINVSERIAIRAIHADYLRTRFGDERQNNLRLSFGIVFK